MKFACFAAVLLSVIVTQPTTVSAVSLSQTASTAVKPSLDDQSAFMQTISQGSNETKSKTDAATKSATAKSKSSSPSASSSSDSSKRTDPHIHDQHVDTMLTHLKINESDTKELMDAKNDAMRALADSLQDQQDRHQAHSDEAERQKKRVIALYKDQISEAKQVNKQHHKEEKQNRENMQSEVDQLMKKTAEEIIDKAHDLMDKKCASDVADAVDTSSALIFGKYGKKDANECGKGASALAPLPLAGGGLGAGSGSLTGSSSGLGGISSSPIVGGASDPAVKALQGVISHLRSTN